MYRAHNVSESEAWYWSLHSTSSVPGLVDPRWGTAIVGATIVIGGGGTIYPNNPRREVQELPKSKWLHFPDTQIRFYSIHLFTSFPSMMIDLRSLDLQVKESGSRPRLYIRSRLANFIFLSSIVKTVTPSTDIALAIMWLDWQQWIEAWPINYRHIVSQLHCPKIGTHIMSLRATLS